jgi:tetratricopeptide (TPR) repeat protein
MTQLTLQQAIRVAVQHHQAGRLSEAEAIYRQVLAANPIDAAALELLGTLLAQKGDLRGGEDALRQSLRIAPTGATAYFNLGEICRRLGRPAESLATIMEGIRYRPNRTAYENMAAALCDLKHTEAAIDALRMAVRFDPTSDSAKSKLDALSAMPGKSRLDPGEIHEARVCVALSATLAQLHRYDEAIAMAERSIALAPMVTDPMINLGWLYTVVGRHDDAIGICRRATELDPGNGPAFWNMGLTHLLLGDFARGWELHEWRHKCPGFNFPGHTQPYWTGQPLAGKTILLWFEQGLGDTIQFVRFVPNVKELGAKVLLSVQPELRRLIENSIPADEYLPPRQPAPSADFQCALMSLAYVFKTDLRTIPAQTPYLAPPADLVAKWGERVAPFRDRVRVGLAWAGRVGHINDSMRSMHICQLAPLTSSGAALFSLQKWKIGMGVSEPDPAMQLIDWTADFTDMADTAALIANLDLVVAVDTAVAHLAGTMNKPTWLLLPKAPDWRWLLDREDSPWYPSMRLFRQAKLGDWEAVIVRVLDALKGFKR